MTGLPSATLPSYSTGMSSSHSPFGTVLAAPSILAADFADVASGLKVIERAGGDWVHLDVMDGHFVPNLTFGPKMVSDIRTRTRLPLDAHLMVDKPESMIEQFAAAGADHLTFHIEAGVHAHRTIQQIHAAGVKPGISIVPSTPVSAITELLGDVFQVLVMTVNPGFGGQSMIPQCVEKVRELNRMRQVRGLSFHIAVDGGINEKTAPTVRDAGATVLVSGSAFFRSPDPAREISMLKGMHIA